MRLLFIIIYLILFLCNNISSLRNKPDILADKQESNSVGRKVENSQITTPPYKIERCDQIVALPGKRLLSYDDFFTKAEAFFDIGMYIINMYEKNDAGTFIQSIDTQLLEGVPEVILGSATCLKIVDKKSNLKKSFGMCLPDKETVKSIQGVIEDFLYNCSEQNKRFEKIENIFDMKSDGSKKIARSQLIKKHLGIIRFGKNKGKNCDEVPE